MLIGVRIDVHEIQNKNFYLYKKSTFTKFDYTATKNIFYNELYAY